MMVNVSISATPEMLPIVKVLDAKVGYITEDRSEVGNVNCTELADNLNRVMEYGGQVFTKYFETIASNYLLPTNIMGIFNLSDLSVKYHDGFIEAGLTPTFI